MGNHESGMSPIGMTIFNPLNEYWQSRGSNQRPCVLKSCTLPTELRLGLTFTTLRKKPFFSIFSECFLPYPRQKLLFWQDLFFVNYAFNLVVINLNLPFATMDKFCGVCRLRSASTYMESDLAPHSPFVLSIVSVSETQSNVIQLTEIRFYTHQIFAFGSIRVNCRFVKS